MSGEQNSAAKSKLCQVNEILDKFECDNKIVPNQQPEKEEEIAKILNLSPDLINKISPEMCWEYALRLSQYANYIQRLVNREKAIEKWSHGAILDAAAPQFSQHGYMSEDAKISIIAKTDNYILELIKIRRGSLLKMTRLEYFSHSLKDQANLFLTVKRNKERIDV